MLIQCHWQHRLETHRTEFIAQLDAGNTRESVTAALKAADDAFHRHLASRPGEDWHPMVCTEDSEHFMLAANPPAVVAAAP